jgi:hypothetical protein
MLAGDAKEGPKPNESRTAPKQQGTTNEHGQGMTKLKGETTQKEAGTIAVKECRSGEARATVYKIRWRDAVRGFMGRERDQADTNGVSAQVAVSERAKEAAGA